jgi:anti-sigma B factor antagonist
MPDPSDPTFDVTLVATDHATQLGLHGELDLASAPRLAERLEEACRNSRALVIDVAELRFCDSSGIRELLKAAARCAQDGTEFKVVGAAGTVRRVFEVSGVAETLGLAEQ